MHGKHLQAQRFQELLLTLNPPDITQLIGTETHVLAAIFPVQMLVSVLDVNFQIGIGVFITHVLVYIQVHAADQVDDFNKALPVSQRVIVNGYAQQVGDGLLGHGHPSIGIGRVQFFVLGMARQQDHGIPGQGQQ